MNLKFLRENHNMTQQEVADYLNCSAAAYSRYESGVREPSIEVLIKLADLFTVTLDYLVGRDAPNNNDSDIMDSSKSHSDYEVELLSASRLADTRAREDALHLLLFHHK